MLEAMAGQPDIGPSVPPEEREAVVPARRLSELVSPEDWQGEAAPPAQPPSTPTTARPPRA